jgi:hypothetical protein
MKTRLPFASLVLILFGAAASAHRVDEYLQATTISLEKDRVRAQIRLTPGVAVFHSVIATIDTNGDGVISPAEERDYSGRVLGDLSLSIDGERLKLQLISTTFPTADAMREGLGQIQIDFAADVRRDKSESRIVFENHHQRRIGSYLVNCLVPRDPDIRVTAQNRNYEQSVYQLDFVQGGIRSGPLSLMWWSNGRGWFASFAILLLAPMAFLLRKRARA